MYNTYLYIYTLYPLHYSYSIVESIYEVVQWNCLSKNWKTSVLHWNNSWIKVFQYILPLNNNSVARRTTSSSTWTSGVWSNITFTLLYAVIADWCNPGPCSRDDTLPLILPIELSEPQDRQQLWYKWISPHPSGLDAPFKGKILLGIMNLLQYCHRLKLALTVQFPLSRGIKRGEDIKEQKKREKGDCWSVVAELNPNDVNPSLLFCQPTYMVVKF